MSTPAVSDVPDANVGDRPGLGWVDLSNSDADGPSFFTKTPKET